MTIKDESLGIQTISGVPAEGRRTTITYPAGSYMGNDRPVTTVSEIWTHTGTRTVLLMKNSHPTMGDSTTVMEDFSVAEPDAALFQVPPGYQVVDESGPFKIVLPLEK